MDTATKEGVTMGYRKNQANYVSNEEMLHGDSALYYGCEPGTPSKTVPYWSAVRGYPGGGYDVCLWERDKVVATIPMSDIKAARTVARNYARVRGDGLHRCFGWDDREGCKSGSILTKDERERGWCERCHSDMMAYCNDEGTEETE
jgi:hypothetical protein